MSTLGYLVAAYVFLWALVFGYVYTVARRQRSLERDIQVLRQVVEKEQTEI